MNLEVNLFLKENDKICAFKIKNKTKQKFIIHKTADRLLEEKKEEKNCC
jgi:hypothetical protein